MKKFEFLDITTADIAFLAYGKDLNELFENSALALFEVMTDTKKVKPEIKQEINIKSQDLQSLLFDWLNELLYFVDSKNLLFSKFGVEIDEKSFSLYGVCEGEEMDSKKHELRTHVKSATYHKMEIKKVKNKWQAQVILDI